jgi:hypothetical protein
MGVNSGLYALDERLLALEEKISSQGGEVLPEDEEILAELAEDGRELADQLAKWKRNAEFRAEGFADKAAAFAEEASRLRRLAATEKASADFAKSRLIWLLDKMEMRSVRTSVGTVSVCKAGKPAIRVECEIRDLPEGFRRLKVTEEWVRDDEAILEAEEQGCLPDNIRIERNRTIRLSATKEEKIHADAIS